MAALAATVLALSAPASAANLYKITGPDGKVTYSDKPPTTAKEAEKTEKMQGALPAGDPDAAKKMAQQESEFQKRADERQATEKKAADEKKEKADLLRRCQDARTNVRQLRDTGMVLYRPAEKEGEREAMTMDARLKEATRVEEDMKKAGCE